MQNIKKIPNDNLHSVFLRNSDLEGEDLENLIASIKENGFTVPIEVTNFGSDGGEYMIVSGHRRHAAGVKCGITSFPCIVKQFDTFKEAWDYWLSSNTYSCAIPADKRSL